MSRIQWRAVWRWMRVEKKRIAWEFGPRYPETPIFIDWGKIAWPDVPAIGIRKLGSFPT